jgi:hypothetical protein
VFLVSNSPRCVNLWCPGAPGSRLSPSVKTRQAGRLHHKQEGGIKLELVRYRYGTSVSGTSNDTYVGRG